MLYELENTTGNSTTFREIMTHPLTKDFFYKLTLDCPFSSPERFFLKSRMRKTQWIKAAPTKKSGTWVRFLGSFKNDKCVKLKIWLEKNTREKSVRNCGGWGWTRKGWERDEVGEIEKLISAPGGRLFRIVSDAASQAVVLAWLSVAILHETVTFLLFSHTLWSKGIGELVFRHFYSFI